MWRRGLSGMFLISWVVCAAAQTRLYINIDQVGSHLLPLAIPKLMGETADPELGRRIRTVLQHDLERSGLFRIVDPATYIDEVPQALDHLNYQNWSASGAVAVVTGRLQFISAGAQLKLELVLHDVARQQRHFNGKEYVAPPGRYREMAHRFSDMVFQALTGNPGPFNTQVVCVTPHGAGRRGKDIILMDYDGHEVRQLVTDGSLNLAPVLSPDGLLLAYTSYRSGTPDLYIRNLLLGSETRITSEPGLALAGSWSPNGRYLALSRTIDGNSDIHLYDTQQKQLTRLTTYRGIDVSPSFAPDGRRLVFTSDRNGSPQLYLIDIRGGHPFRLTYEGRYNTSPTWSPQGDRIAFVGGAEDRSLNIYIIRSDGERLHRLTSGGSDYESPTWSPNGHFVMFISRRGDTWQRYLAHHNVQEYYALPARGPTCRSPRWVARTGF
ncbi:MAG: Tol-Pal system beta propeller repeat protein TolB [bacterium]|nr:Tol-Pal system beta propeller repeat protein TolB [bacterium]